MTFPLMPEYDHINVVANLDPVAAVRDDELGGRMRTYTKLLPAGSPDFGFAVQTGTEWRVGSLGASDPEGARRDLASHLRRGAAEQESAAKLARAMRAVADKLDPEFGEQLAKDEWEIGDRRYRVIRVERFVLIGYRVMEPPRSTDADVAGGDGLLSGYLIDPGAPAGRWEAQLRLNLVRYLPKPDGVSAAERAEARHAVHAYPGVTLLPPTFTVVETKGDSWRPLTYGDCPGEARSRLAEHFTELLPRLREFQGNPATPTELAQWAEAAERIKTTTGHKFTVLGRHFRTVRVLRVLRVGRDGPEGPRPADQERYGMSGTAQPLV